MAGSPLIEAKKILNYNIKNMLVKLSGIVADTLKKRNIEYNGKNNRVSLLNEIKKMDQTLSEFSLDLAINSELSVNDDDSFEDTDDLLIFNAFAGG